MTTFACGPDRTLVCVRDSSHVASHTETQDSQSALELPPDRELVVIDAFTGEEVALLSAGALLRHLAT